MKIEKIVLVDPAIPETELGDLGPGFREDMEMIGIRYVAASLSNEGYKVTIISQNNKNAEQVFEEIKKIEPDIVGFSIFTAALNNAKMIAKKIKNSLSLIIIVGGVHISTDYMNLDDVFDFAVVGEGEKTILKLLSAISHNSDIDRIKGICYRKNGRIKFTGFSSRIEDLDDIPFPMRNIKELKLLKGQLPRPSQANGYATLISSRGCYGKCTFCVNNTMWRSRRTSRSTKNVLNEIIMMYKQGVNYFWFGDDNFTQNREWILEFAHEILHKKRNKEISEIFWACMGRINDIDDEMLIAMKKSGCVQIGFGIESVDSSILKSYNKGILPENASNIIKKTVTHGIMTSAYFLIGTIGETQETLNATREFIIKELCAIRLRIVHVYPFPGTILRKEVDEKNLWISKKHKSSDYANVEVPVIKNKLIEKELIDYQKEVTRSYYYSKRYDTTIDMCINNNPKLNDTLISWKNAMRNFYK